jgi:hypothetical protein
MLDYNNAGGSKVDVVLCLGASYGRRLGLRYSEVNLTDVANDHISPQGV